MVLMMLVRWSGMRGVRVEGYLPSEANFRKEPHRHGSTDDNLLATRYLNAHPFDRFT
jgi:hypothetical protein